MNALLCVPNSGDISASSYSRVSRYGCVTYDEDVYGLYHYNCVYHQL